MSNLSLLTLAVLLAFTVTGCANVAQVNDKASTAAAQSVPASPLTWAAVKERTGTVAVGWVAAFNDPILDKLVLEAQANNRDLQAAAASLEASGAMAEQAGAALKPSVSLNAGGKRAGAVKGGASNSYSVGVKASWEADIWGRIKSGEQAATASFEAAQADYRYSQHSLAGGVARAYFVAIEAQLQQQVSQSIVDSVTKTSKIVQAQFKNGLAGAQDLALIKADLATAQEGLASAEGGQRDAIRALEELLGRYPGADLEVRDSLPVLPEPPAAGVPSDILERRPDLVAAERRIAAAMNATDQAKAARLPKISLTASTGGSSNQLSSLLNPANLVWQAATSLLAPLYDGGAGAAQVKVTTAEQKAAVAAYAQTALVAFGEVETALDQRLTLQRRADALAVAEQESNEALRLAQLRFKEGEAELLDVLSVQQRVDGAQSNLLSVRRAQLQQFVELNLALGGDWQATK